LGAHVPVTDYLPLTLVAAPSYAEIDALAKDAREPASYVAEVAWRAVRLRAEILLVVYLDNISPAKFFWFDHTAVHSESRGDHR